MATTKKAAGAGSEEIEATCRRKINQWRRCKNASADNELRYCEKHYEEKKNLPPDGQRCSHIDGKGWRCKNFRWIHGTKMSKYCEKHYNYYANRYKKDDEKTSETIIQDGSANIGTKMEKKKLPPDERYCCQSNGVWRCKNFRMSYGAAADDATVPKTKYCEKHYHSYVEANKLKKKEMKRKKLLPPDEQYCFKSNGLGWRCKNIRMGHDAADDDTVPKSRYCEKHHNYFAKYLKKNRSGNGEASLIPSDKVKLPPDEVRCCQINGLGWRCKNFRMGHGAAVDDDTVPKTRYCEKHYNFRAKYLKKNRSGNVEASLIPSNKVKLPPDEVRCCQTDGKRWRCENFRMNHGAADNRVPKTKSCEKHYNYFAQAYKKKTSTKDGDPGAGSGPIEVTWGSKRKRNTKVMEEEADDTSVTTVEGGTGNIKRKRKNVERVEDDQFVDDIHGESEDFDGYLDSENSAGDLMDMLGMGNWNWNNDEMKWNSEADMLASFEEDPLLLYL